MTIAQRDIISGTVIAAGAAAFYLYADSMPVRQGQALAISPGFYPRLLALMMLVFSGIQIVTSLLTMRRERAAVAAGAAHGDTAGVEAAPPAQTGAMWKDRRAVTLFSIVLGALIAYPIVINYIGFTLTSLLFVGGTTVALSTARGERREQLTMAAVTIGITLIVWLVFRLMLRIPFPQGVFGP